MASKEQEEDLAFSAAYEDDTPTPSGWKRKLVPRIGKGMVPVRTDVIFITPSGEEFKSRAELQRYLKAHKGSPSLSEFIWIVDGMPQRSTRSKSAPMVKLLELPPRAASKRKSGTEINEIGGGKRRRKEKTHKSEEGSGVIKGNHLKNVDITILGEEKEEGIAFAGSSPASAKKKRSLKVARRIKRGPTLAETYSAKTNGIAEVSTKDEKADETAKAKNASKRKRSRGRPGGTKGGVPQDQSDDQRQAADVDVNDDEMGLSAGATNPESNSNGRVEGDHSEEKVDADPNDETTAEIA